MLVELQNKEFMHATVRKDVKKRVKKARNEKGVTSRAGGATVRRHMHQAKIKAAIAG